MAAERRRSLIIKIVSAIALIVVAAVVIFWAVNKNSEDSATGGDSVPSVVTADGAIRITKAEAGTTPPAVVTVVEDFQCPACQSFESAYGPTLAKLSENPAVAIDYQTVTFLDRASTTRYSSRAANASMCVAEATGKGGDFSTWLTFHNSLFANQPAEGGAGLDDRKLVSLAKDAGVGGAQQCIEDQQFGQWIGRHSDEVMGSGVDGTPTVRINGEKVELTTPAELEAAVLAAASAAPAQ